jgi:hypothetical protein
VSKSETVSTYLAALPSDRKDAMTRLVDTIRDSLPVGYQEVINYGMPSWVIPHTMYAAGYHVDPKLPLPFLSIASQKSHMAVYHMGLYAHVPLNEWFVNAYPKHSKTKLNMGKSCIRFKRATHIPYVLIGELCTKMAPAQWIAVYESQVKKV